MDKDPNFPQIKRDLIERIVIIENYIKEGVKTRESILELLTKLNTKIYGSDDTDPPKIGMEARLKALENTEQGRNKLKHSFLKVAVGSLTMAVGAMVIWVFNVVRDAFIKPH